jgi:hypothetical protein
MYGLPQAGIIAQELLQEHLAKVGYYQSKIIPGFWTHITKKTCFTLVVDNFAIKYTNLDNAKHLIDTLKKDYVIQSTGTQQNTLDLPLSGNTQKEKYTFTCRDTYQMHYSNSTLQNQRKSRTRHTHMSSPNMELKFNMHQTPTLPPPPQQRGDQIYTGGYRNPPLLWTGG